MAHPEIVCETENENGVHTADSESQAYNEKSPAHVVEIQENSSSIGGDLTSVKPCLAPAADTSPLDNDNPAGSPSEYETKSTEEPCGSVKPLAKVVSGNHRGRGKARGKKFGKVKGKPKAATKVKSRHDASQSTEAKPKAQGSGGSLKSIVDGYLCGRDIDEVLEQAKRDVKDCEEEVKKAQEEDCVDAPIENAKARMDVAEKMVEEAINTETIALDKLKRAEKAKSDTVLEVRQGKVDLVTCAMVLKVLEFRQTRADRLSKLREARSAAQEASEAARASMEDCKKKERLAVEALKAGIAEQRVEELESLRQAGADATCSEVAKTSQAACSSLKKNLAAGLAEREKLRQLRDKERQKRKADAARLTPAGRNRKLKALMMTPAGCGKEAPVPENTNECGKDASVPENTDDICQVKPAPVNEFIDDENTSVAA